MRFLSNCFTPRTIAPGAKISRHKAFVISHFAVLLPSEISLHVALDVAWGVRGRVAMYQTEFVRIPSSVNDDCEDCGQVQNLRDDEHNVSDHARIGQEQQGGQKPEVRSEMITVGDAVRSCRRAKTYRKSRRRPACSPGREQGQSWRITFSREL